MAVIIYRPTSAPVLPSWQPNGGSPPLHFNPPRGALVGGGSWGDQSDATYAEMWFDPAPVDSTYTDHWVVDLPTIPAGTINSALGYFTVTKYQVEYGTLLNADVRDAAGVDQDSQMVSGSGADGVPVTYVTEGWYAATAMQAGPCTLDLWISNSAASRPAGRQYDVHDVWFEVDIDLAAPAAAKYLRPCRRFPRG